MVDWEHRQTEEEDMLYLLLERSFIWVYTINNDVDDSVDNDDDADRGDADLHTIIDNQKKLMLSGESVSLIKIRWLKSLDQIYTLSHAHLWSQVTRAKAHFLFQFVFSDH